MLQALDAIGLKLEQCATGGEKGGTSTTGNQGRRFFSEEAVSTIESLLPEKHKENVLLLHKYLSAVFRVISSRRKVDMNLFQELCINISLLIANEFSWAKLNHTLHGVLHHSAELMIWNVGYGLGAYSEEGLEANNKDIRNFLETHSRKCSPVEQMKDVTNRLLERSDPVQCEKMKNIFNNKHCTVCSDNDHTIRSHGSKRGLPKKEFDTFVEELFE